MSAKALMIVILMLIVPTIKEVIHVIVRMGTLEMENFVLVCSTIAAST